MNLGKKINLLFDVNRTTACKEDFDNQNVSAALYVPYDRSDRKSRSGKMPPRGLILGLFHRDNEAMIKKAIFAVQGARILPIFHHPLYNPTITDHFSSISTNQYMASSFLAKGMLEEDGMLVYDINERHNVVTAGRVQFNRVSISMIMERKETAPYVRQEHIQAAVAGKWQFYRSSSEKPVRRADSAHIPAFAQASML